MSIVKTAEEVLGISKTEIDKLRHAMPNSPLKRLMEYDLELTIHNRRLNDPTEEKDIHFERGVREGLAIAKGLLNKK